jgi:hypothetical protein
MSESGDASPETSRAVFGPVLPLYLDLDEVHVLEVAVAMLAQVDGDIVAGHAGRWFSDTSRADQVAATARDRLPLLSSLSTALAEHRMALERVLEAMRGDQDPG